MDKRRRILIGIGAGLLWGIVLLWIGTVHVKIPPFSRIVVTPFFALAPGIVLTAMIGAVAVRRLLDDTLAGGAAPAPGSPGDIDRRVLKDSIEQSVLALCLWLPLSYMLLADGLGVIMTLSVGFAVARVIYWIGCHKSLPLQLLGFGATFFPTVLALLWALALRMT